MNDTPAPISVLVCALGGEGGGVLSEWLYDAAVLAGYAAQCTSVPGVAQRTGATTYYIEIHPQPVAQLGTRRPVFSLNPVPGALDLLVSSELLETARQVGNGLCDARRTRIISSTARALTVAEKMQLGDGRVDAGGLRASLQQQGLSCDLLDMDALARQAGTAISAVLLGAIAASGCLPLPRGAFEEAIRRAGKGVDASLRGFALAYKALGQARAQRERVERALRPAQAACAEPDLRALARQRLADYQDADYVRLYDERLARIAAAEAGVHGDGPTLREVTRWLALWMCFDDIVRVGQAKLAASRQQRVRREVGAADGDIVKVFDLFKPGIPELAALLPRAIAERVLAWDRARVAAGQEPWAWPMKIGSHTLRGALALRLVAALKGQRRRGSRFAQEQQLIERWLAAIERGLKEDAGLGLELARCGRLVKGYGSTNERGKHNLLHIIDHLAFGAVGVLGALGAAERAQAVRAACEAALSDEGGQALDRTLLLHGAPARPPREQPVRWFKRRPSPG